MAFVISEREQNERDEAVKLLRDQIETEKLLIDQYKDFGGKVANIGVRRMLRMIMYDSLKHIEILKTAIDNIEGQDILKEDRMDIKKGLRRHLELEMSSIENAEKVLKYNWLRNTQGLRELIEIWRDDEKRHHTSLKRLSEKPFIEADPNDWASLLRGYDDLEKKYLHSKRMYEG